MRSWWIAATARLEPVALATLSLGAAAIHFAVIAEHFEEYFLFGAFFSLIGWFQALWAIGYVLRPGRWLVLLGLLANTATVLIWAWAHVVGLPFGPTPGQVEPTSVTDLMATVFELLLVTWLMAVLILGRRSWPSSRAATSPEPIRIAAVVGLMVAGQSGRPSPWLSHRCDAGVSICERDVAVTDRAWGAPLSVGTRPETSRAPCSSMRDHSVVNWRRHSCMCPERVLDLLRVCVSERRGAWIA